ncbi:MAG: potassium channel protein [Acidisphaera sp.]|nr:potassium channel protein [Acidisphaera sp.]MBV9811761.1 potassium channel protein [Acetobacteraceae bacterium]
MLAAISAYTALGWSVGDALYMVVLTVFTVGYDEVQPIDTAALRGVTIALIGFGCTGMIFVTGALVQFITATQFSDVLERRRMSSRIDHLSGHVIVCGFGRVGVMLATDLAAAKSPFVILESSEDRVAQAQEAGFLAMRADATEELALTRARIAQARALATVLPNDAANVFITLSARNLNRDLVIISRGEATSTERKLKHAGADHVVLPAHIGAERIAELLLFPAIADSMNEQRAVGGGMDKLGLASEVVVAAAASPWVGLTVSEIERRAESAFVIVELERAGTRRRERARDDVRVAAGDGVLVIGRSTSAAVQGFLGEQS